MKIILFLIAFSPFYLLAQNTTIDLKEYGLNASLSNPDNYTYSVKKSTEDGATIYTIDINENTIKISDYPKPITAKKMMDIYFGMPNTKSKTSKFKILDKKPNKCILEANYNGSVRYTFFYAVASKGKQIIVEGTSKKDLETCKMLQKIGETFILN